MGGRLETRVKFPKETLRLWATVSIGTRRWAGRSDVRRVRCEYFVLLRNVHAGSWPQSSFLFNGYRGGKWLDYEADHSYPSRDEVKNECSYTSTPLHMHSWRGYGTLLHPKFRGPTADLEMGVRMVLKGIVMKFCVYLIRLARTATSCGLFCKLWLMFGFSNDRDFLA